MIFIVTPSRDMVPIAVARAGRLSGIRSERRRPRLPSMACFEPDGPNKSDRGPDIRSFLFQRQNLAEKRPGRRWSRSAREFGRGFFTSETGGRDAILLRAAATPSEISASFSSAATLSGSPRAWKSGMSVRFCSARRVHESAIVEIRAISRSESSSVMDTNRSGGVCFCWSRWRAGSARGGLANGGRSLTRAVHAAACLAAGVPAPESPAAADSSPLDLAAAPRPTTSPPITSAVESRPIVIALMRIGLAIREPGEIFMGGYGVGF